MPDSKAGGFSGPELCALSAHDAALKLRKGEISPGELLAASRARVERAEPAVNAMPTLCWERAEGKMASLVDGPADHPGWLGGLPVAIKDLTPVAGVRTTFGTKALAGNVPGKSDRLVLRLEERGALVVGKTNTPEFGVGGNTFNEVFGATRNPWNCSLNAGGSSGGSAAALACGEVWLAHGSDLAGSLRTPAAYCGVVGFRPGPGIAGGAPEGLAFHTEGVQGPMARSVLDCALFLDAMSGFDPSSPISFPAPCAPYQEAVLKAGSKVRIAYSPDLNGFGSVERSMGEHLSSALSRVEREGAVVVEDCPDLPDLDKTYRVLRAMLWAALPGRAPREWQRHFKRTLKENIEYGRNLSIDDVYDAQLGRTRLFENVASFLRGFDVLACPVVGLHPGPVEEEYPKFMDGEPLDDYITWLRFSYLSTATGLPSVSVPVGLNESGVPVGLQLIGPHRGEARLLAAARAVEMAVGGPLGPIDPNASGESAAQS